jgi:spermidine synthase
VVEPEYQLVLTNESFHQALVDFDADNPRIQTAAYRFAMPYRLARSLDRVLVVGAGTGNDLAIALRAGAKKIDAVEIDRVFTEIGRRSHRQRPYQDPRVTLHVGDARAYFKRCQNKYDLIVFGTLDSQALLGGLSSVRLDNYVYTREAFQEAHRLLKPDGLLAVLHMATSEHRAPSVRPARTGQAKYCTRDATTVHQLRDEGHVTSCTVEKNASGDRRAWNRI